MSIEATYWALTTADVRNPTETCVLLGLANHTDKYGHNAWPAVATLAGYARCSERTVQRTLNELEDRRVICEGDQSMASSHRADRRPVVWDILMGEGSTLLLNPDWTDDYVQARSRGVRLSPRDRVTLGSRGDTGDAYGVSPLSPEPSIGTVLSYESAGAERYSDEGPRIVTPLRPPKKQRSGQRRVEVPENSPTETAGRTIGMPHATDRSKRIANERAAVARPDSGGGLSRYFGILASQAGLAGPQQVNGAALAKNLTSWMSDGQNPDTPAVIRAMMEAFFATPKPRSDRPLWRRFLAEAPALRVAHAKAQPIDYRAAEARDLEQARIDAARGDIRAQKLIDGEDKPWRTWARNQERA